MNRYATLRHGLVGAWCPSLRAGGYVLEDRSNVRYNGTLINSPTWSAGALSLTAASSQYVSVWDRTRVSLTDGEMSITAWIRPTTVSGTQEIAATTGASGGNCNFCLEIGRTAGRVSWLQDAVSGAQTSTASISANTWSFIGATRYKDGSNWIISLFINNVQEIFTTATNPAATPSSTLSIGRLGAANLFYFGGLIDDVRIWNRCLSPLEVRTVGTARGFGLLPQRTRRANVLGSQFWLRDAGTWKKATGWIKVGGVWTKATPKINVSGAWK